MNAVNLARSGLSYAVAVAVGFCSVLPLVVFAFQSVTDPYGAARSSIDAFEMLIPPILNSLAWSLLVSVVGVVLAWVLLLSVEFELVLFMVVVLLFCPGLVSALGFNYFVGHVVPLSWDIAYWKGGAFFVALLGYIVPYQLVAAIWSYSHVPVPERRAVMELCSSYAALRYWSRRLGPSSVMIILIGLGMALTEVPRSRALGVDSLGFGSEFLGPWIASRHNTVGLASGMFPLLASFVLGGGLLVIWSQGRRGSR